VITEHMCSEVWEKHKQNIDAYYAFLDKKAREIGVKDGQTLEHISFEIESRRSDMLKLQETYFGLKSILKLKQERHRSMKKK
jgi:hypothetical protein